MQTFPACELDLRGHLVCYRIFLINDFQTIDNHRRSIELRPWRMTRGECIDLRPYTKAGILIDKFSFFTSFENTDCVAQIPGGEGREKTAERAAEDQNARTRAFGYALQVSPISDMCKLRGQT